MKTAWKLLRVAGQAGAALLLPLWLAAADDTLVQVSNPAKVGLRMPIPVVADVEIAKLPAGVKVPGAASLVEEGKASVIPAQIESEPARPGLARLWWVMPPSATSERTFRFTAASAAGTSLTVTADVSKQTYDLAEDSRPILRYNHGTVPTPRGVPTNYARGDYIMPLFGLDGVVLTDDYPKDHPHHRGIGWSWPVTRWGKEVRDIWAVVGVWSRPVAIRRSMGGPVFAVLEAENVWKWGDTTPIVKELVTIRAFSESDSGRFVDVEVHLTALTNDVAIGGRPHGAYGGFGLRAMPAADRVITSHTDPPGQSPRRSWLDYSGVFAGAKAPAGLAILESPENSGYPSTLLSYPQLNYVMPAFPGEREVPLSTDKPLVLRHRLWIHPGMAGTNQLADVWAAYASPPKTRVGSAPAKN